MQTAVSYIWTYQNDPYKLHNHPMSSKRRKQRSGIANSMWEVQGKKWKECSKFITYLQIFIAIGGGNTP